MKLFKIPVFFLLLSLVYGTIIFGTSYKKLDPAAAKLLQNLEKQDGPPIYTLSPAKARTILDTLQAPSVDTIPADVQDVVIPDGSKPKKEISLRIVRPLGTEHEKLPIIVYIHGGGWILGNKYTHDRLIRKIANQANAAVVFVNYSLSPEAQYPTAIEQAYETVKYLAKYGSKFSLDSKRIAIAGDSVGGLMAAVVTQLAKQRSGPKILFQLLFYPVTDANFNTDSYKQFANGYWLTKKAMKWFWDAYAPDHSIRTNPSVSPLRAKIEQLKGLPPTLIFTNENDVLRDEGQAYAKRLMQAGVDVTALQAVGMIHDSVMLDPLKDSPTTNSMIDFASQKLKQVLYS